MIEKEMKEYLESWGEKKLLEALSELIILTGSHCLRGKEIRSQLPVHIWVEVLAMQPGRVSGSSSGDQEYFLYNNPETQRKKSSAFSQLCSILPTTVGVLGQMQEGKLAGLLGSAGASPATAGWMGFSWAGDQSVQEKR